MSFQKRRNKNHHLIGRVKVLEENGNSRAGYVAKVISVKYNLTCSTFSTLWFSFLIVKPNTQFWPLPLQGKFYLLCKGSIYQHFLPLLSGMSSQCSLTFKYHLIYCTLNPDIIIVKSMGSRFKYSLNLPLPHIGGMLGILLIFLFLSFLPFKVRIIIPVSWYCCKNKWENILKYFHDLT